MPRKKQVLKSALVRTATVELKKRIKAVGAERDALREIADDCIDLADSCDDAIGDIQSAIDALSKYA